MFIFIDKVIIGLFWNIYFTAIHPSANERTKFDLDTDTQGIKLLSIYYPLLYGELSKDMSYLEVFFLLYEHYKKLIEIMQ